MRIMKHFWAAIFASMLLCACNLVQRNNEVWYTTLDGSVVSVTDPDLCDAGEIVNTNTKGWGVLKFSAPVDFIGAELLKDNAKLSSVSLPVDVAVIDNFAFTNCPALKSVAMFDKVESIGTGAFMGCTSLTDITFSRSLATICAEAFKGCGFIGVTLPQSLVELSEGAFSDSPNLKSATISGAVKSIGDRAFAQSPNLAYFYCKALVPPTLGKGVFENASYSLKIYVPNESLELYKWAPTWREHKHRLVGFDFK